MQTQTMAILSYEDLTAIVEEAVKKSRYFSPCYSKQAASELLEVPVRTIDRWCSKGVLREVKIGGRVYIDGNSIANYFFKN